MQTNVIEETKEARMAAIGPSNAREILDLSVGFWFAIALVGQWLFAGYVLVYFGGVVARDGIGGFSDTHIHINAGDPIGNIAVISHVLIAIAVHGFGPLQFVPFIRIHWPRAHRWIGRSFLFAVAIASFSGLYLVLNRGTAEGWVADSTNVLDSVLIFSFGYLAVWNAIKRDFRSHRRWALRLFIASSAVWFVRLNIFGTGLITNWLGIDFGSIASIVFTSAHIAKLVIPLGLLELYLWADRCSKPRWLIASAGVMVMAAIATGLGIYAVTINFWLGKMFG